MSSKNKIIDDVNKYFQEALTLKSKAIKPNSALDLFRQAAEKFNTACELINTLISQETENSDRIRSQALCHYYCHEEYDCLYAFFLKNNDLDVAQERIDTALKEISKALNIIEQNLNMVNQSTKTFLIKMKTDWLYRELVTEAKTFEPKAKTKSQKSDFIGALDTYKTMLDKYSQAKDYCLEKDLSPELKRISRGNYFGQSVNVCIHPTNPSFR
jgi:tetratricopeptide (TPR) repeat protein